MNLNENLFGGGARRNQSSNKKGKRQNVMTIQRGTEAQRKKSTPKRKNVFDATICSSDYIWPNTTNMNSLDNTVTSSRSLSTNELDNKIILAISEGRGEASCEVGIASINVTRPELILCQISDSQSYINVLTKINVLNPVEILIPITMAYSRLTNKIKETFESVKITGVSRQSFNKNNGMTNVRQLCAPDWNSIFLILQHKYYALTAASALITYLETNLCIYLSKESIKIDYQQSEGFTIIDVFTADKLELVACAISGHNTKYSSLRGILNHCVTKIGARTLRASILQPSCSVPDIEARLDCVEELVRQPDKILYIQGLLKQISNIDQLLNVTTVIPEQAQSCSGRQLNYILLLNSLFDLLEPLKTTFQSSKQPFFIELKETLSCAELYSLMEIIRAIIHTDARPSTGEQGIIERCFAVKSGVSEVLDIIRKNYSEKLDRMREYVKELGKNLNMDLKLANNTKKGYHIVLSLNINQRRNFKKSDLPPEFIQVERKTTMVTMKTAEILTYSARLEDIITEILKLSNILIYNVLLEIRKRVSLFYKLCDDIAKLDLIQSLAKASINNPKYVRPKFGEITEVLNGRHPLLDYLCDVEPISNNILASPQYNVNIITGPNGSGKSILIRQIVLLQVMAQVGCYVPATSATFRVADRILARIYLEDNMDYGASAFVLEMKEIQYFHSVLTQNSLIIIDELCRSTSIDEGTALAMAICENFLDKSSFVFFTTHYTMIAKLQDMYFNVKCWQLEAKEVQEGDRIALKFTYQVFPGVTSMKEYAIYLAKASWHDVVMQDVENILKYMDQIEEDNPSHVIHPAIRLKYDLESELGILKSNKRLTAAALREKLYNYQIELQALGFYIDWGDENEDGSPGSNRIKESVNEEVFYPEAVYSESSSRIEEMKKNNNYGGSLRDNISYVEMNKSGESSSQIEEMNKYDDYGGSVRGNIAYDEMNKPGESSSQIEEMNKYDDYGGSVRGNIAYEEMNKCDESSNQIEEMNEYDKYGGSVRDNISYEEMNKPGESSSQIEEMNKYDDYGGSVRGNIAYDEMNKPGESSSQIEEMNKYDDYGGSVRGNISYEEMNKFDDFGTAVRDVPIGSIGSLPKTFTATIIYHDESSYQNDDKQECPNLQFYENVPQNFALPPQSTFQENLDDLNKSSNSCYHFAPTTFNTEQFDPNFPGLSNLQTNSELYDKPNNFTLEAIKKNNFEQNMNFENITNNIPYKPDIIKFHDFQSKCGNSNQNVSNIISPILDEQRFDQSISGNKSIVESPVIGTSAFTETKRRALQKKTNKSLLKKSLISPIVGNNEKYYSPNILEQLKQKKHLESTSLKAINNVSLNEAQFSLGLQNSLNKTSTPIIKANIYKQTITKTAVREVSNAEDVFKKPLPVKMHGTTTDPDVTAALEDLQNCSSEFEEEWEESDNTLTNVSLEGIGEEEDSEVNLSKKFDCMSKQAHIVNNVKENVEQYQNTDEIQNIEETKDDEKGPTHCQKLNIQTRADKDNERKVVGVDNKNDNEKESKSQADNRGGENVEVDTKDDNEEESDSETDKSEEENVVEVDNTDNDEEESSSEESISYSPNYSNLKGYNNRSSCLVYSSITKDNSISHNSNNGENRTVNTNIFTNNNIYANEECCSRGSEKSINVDQKLTKFKNCEISKHDESLSSHDTFYTANSIISIHNYTSNDSKVIEEESSKSNSKSDCFSKFRETCTSETNIEETEALETESYETTSEETLSNNKKSNSTESSETTSYYTATKSSSNDETAEGITFISNQLKSLQVSEVGSNSSKSAGINVFQRFFKNNLSSISKSNVSGNSDFPPSLKAAKYQFSEKRNVFENTNPDISFNLSESSSSATKKKKFEPPLKFSIKKPLNKLTNEEIKNCYYQRDLQAISSNGISSIEHSKEILNRPTIRQIKGSTPLATATKTKDGSIVVSNQINRKRQYKTKKFKPPLKNNAGKRFNISIFSDKNSTAYEEFLDTKKDADFDFKKFESIFEKNLEGRCDKDDEKFSFIISQDS